MSRHELQIPSVGTALSPVRTAFTGGNLAALPHEAPPLRELSWWSGNIRGETLADPLYDSSDTQASLYTSLDSDPCGHYLEGMAWRAVESRIAVDPRVPDYGRISSGGGRFACSHCGRACPTHDTVEKRWLHQNFFEYWCELVARVAHIECSKHEMRRARVPGPGKAADLRI